MHFFYICPFANFSWDFSMHLFTYVPLPTFPETFKLTFSLYVPKTQGNAHEKENVPHTETFPLSFMYLFFQFCQFVAVHIRCMTALIMAC